MAETVQRPTQKAEEGKIYFLRAGKEHHCIVAGELVRLKGDDGDSTVLTDAQYEVFKDKFLPQGQKNAAAEAAGADAPAPIVSKPDPAKAGTTASTSTSTDSTKQPSGGETKTV